MSPQESGSSPAVPAWERYALTAVFGGLIVATYAYQATVLAASLGWIAYPVVGTAGVVSFLLARAAWNALTDAVQASVDRQERLEAADPD